MQVKLYGGATDHAMNTPVRRAANGQLWSGASLNPGGRPVSAVTELRARYSRRLPELFDDLLDMATNSPNEMVRLGAIRLALDHLLGRPAVCADTTVTKTDLSDAIGEAYRRALIRTNSHVVPSEPVIDDNNSHAGA